MNKLTLTRPTLILLYGFPGAGKTYLARQLCEEINAAHLQADRIRSELFEEPKYDRQENELIDQLMRYMAEEFLSSGLSVVYDTNAPRFGQRRSLRDLARKFKAQPLLIWLQIDIESAFARIVKRDRRKADDKYAANLDRSLFENQTHIMQNPHVTEDYIVISGKHNYTTQRTIIMKKLFDYSLLAADSTATARKVMPGLVNLVPSKPAGGRVDNTRRNIIIR